MARLLSVSVGPPREVECKGKTVRTAVWKSAVRRKVRKLNIDGDGQGDLVGHGSVNLAVAVRLMVNRAPGFGNARYPDHDSAQTMATYAFTVSRPHQATTEESSQMFSFFLSTAPRPRRHLK